MMVNKRISTSMGMIVFVFMLACFVGGTQMAWGQKKKEATKKEAQPQINYQQEYERAKAELNDCQGKYAQIEKENQAMRLDRENLLVQIKGLIAERNRAQELSEELARLKEKLTQAENDSTAFKEEKNALEAKIKMLEATQQGIIKERDDLKIAYEKAKKEDVVSPLRKEVAKLQAEYNTLLSKMKEKDRIIERGLGENKKLNFQISEFKSQLAKLKKEYAQALDKNKRLEQEIKNIPKKFAEIARQNKVLIKQTAEMHYNLGVFYTKNKEYDRAIAEFEKVIEITPDDAYAHFNLGYIYAEYLVNRKKAIEHFRHFLRLAKGEDKDIDWVKKYLLTWETYEAKRPVQ